VGDPEQLPATVISSRATEHGYDTSLFKRLQGAGYPVRMLNVQYRMHPRISAFPSQARRPAAPRAAARLPRRLSRRLWTSRGRTMSCWRS
jgi:senataxin